MLPWCLSFNQLALDVVCVCFVVAGAAGSAGATGVTTAVNAMQTNYLFVLAYYLSLILNLYFL